MTKIGELGFNASPEETFNAIILDVIYTFKQQWNTLGFWTLSVSNEDGSAIVSGVKIVSGSFILAQYPSIPFDLINESDVDPTRLGITDYTLEVYEK